ncbi:MAG: response regulator transcription factor, partial [Bacteroidota bacterium]
RGTGLNDEKMTKKTIRCLIVEDEPLAAEVLSDYVGQLPQLELAGICEDALYALDFLKRESVDLLFLDIHLPKLKGLDFLRSLENPPKVIMTTAYHEYAIDGFELNVIDYLLKPIEFARFLKAVNKASDHLVRPTPSPKPKVGKNAARPFRFFSVNKKHIKIYLDEILYIESLKEYIRIHTPDNTIVTKCQIGEVQSLLHEVPLLRIHRSFIISKDKIEAYSPVSVDINGRQLPIGRSYKAQVMDVLNRLT